MKVRIDAGGREVEIETASDANVSHTEVAETALSVWKQTDGAANSTEGPAYGFSAERACDRDPSSTIRIHPGVPE